MALIRPLLSSPSHTSAQIAAEALHVHCRDARLQRVSELCACLLAAPGINTLTVSSSSWASSPTPPPCRLCMMNTWWKLWEIQLFHLFIQRPCDSVSNGWDKHRGWGAWACTISSGVGQTGLILVGVQALSPPPSLAKGGGADQTLEVSKPPNRQPFC